LEVALGALTATLDNKLVDHVNLTASYTPTSPLKLRLMTANGSASAAGTEVTGGSYGSQTIAFDAASGGSAGNDADITFSGMPACTVVGLEIWDSAGTPVRLWWGPLSTSKTVSAGDAVSFPSGSVIVSLA
jgi:hypothetical protein